MRWCLCVVIAAVFAASAFTQEEQPSLADAARNTREAKTKAAPAKKVITEETIEGEQGPIPSLKFEDRENSEEIIQAILQYKSIHSPEETERVVREWYNHYDAIMMRALDQNAEIRARQEDQRIQPREYPEDYKKYQELRLAEARSAIQDEKLMRQNGAMIGRIQSAFYKVRNDLSMKYRVKYDWLKPSNQNW